MSGGGICYERTTLESEGDAITPHAQRGVVISFFSARDPRS